MICILMGSPKQDGNTASLLKPCIDKFREKNIKVDLIDLYSRVINPCIGCKTCQDVYDSFGCPQVDDMDGIFVSILEADIFILATPIYSWYCTSPMKAMLDRLVYGMNKYYGGLGKKKCLWEGKKCAIVTTCGYPVEKGADIFEQGMKRYFKHSKLEYIGMLSQRDEGYNKVFMDSQKKERAENFAGMILNSIHL